MTLDEYNRMLTAQGGVCAICGVKTARKGWRLAVDHCHATGRVRGLLCHRCNSAIGMMRESAELMRRAADYLNKGDSK